MLSVRLYYLEKYILPRWNEGFTIWSAGKFGRRLYRSLSSKNRQKVLQFCDVDQTKIGRAYEYQQSEQIPKPKIPIISFKQIKPPFLIAVKTDLHEGDLESNIRYLDLDENFDNFVHFG